MKRGLVISVFLLLVVFMFSFGIWLGITGKATSEYKGDVNGDGEVTITDAEFLMKYLSGSGPAPNPLDLGDVNDDGKITLGDVAFLSAYLQQNCSSILSLAKYPLATGDVNEDGVINMEDITFLSNYLYVSQLNPPDPLGLADVNKDGEITLGDMMILNEYVNVRNCSEIAPRGLAGTFFQRGDVTKDRKLTQADRDFLNNYLHVSQLNPPDPLGLADVNKDGEITLGDMMILNEYVNVRNCSNLIPFGEFSLELGDVNKDGVISDLDAELISDYLFAPGVEIEPIELADVNMDGEVGLGGDVMMISSYLHPNDCPPIFYDNGEDPITHPGGSSSSMNIFISSPRNLTYSARTIALEVGDSKNNARYWRYSLNGGSKTNFVPNATIFAQLGENTLSVFGSKYSSFSGEFEKKVSFNVILPTTSSYCGDYVCDEAESCENCGNDCGGCNIPEPGYCGDGSCDFDEDSANCSEDCGRLTVKDYSRLFYTIAGILVLLIVLVSAIIIQKVKIIRGDDLLPEESSGPAQFGGPKPPYFPPITSPPNRFSQFPQGPMNTYSR